MIFRFSMLKWVYSIDSFETIDIFFLGRFERKLVICQIVIGLFVSSNWFSPFIDLD